MKKIIISIMIILGIFAITGCGNDEEKSNEGVNDNIQTNDNKENEKKYSSMQEIILNDESKWIMLEDMGDKVLLFSTKNWGKCTKSEEQEKLEDIKEKLENSLSKNGGNTNGLKVRIPTTDDFTQYFDIDFNNYTNQYHSQVNGSKVSTSLYELVGSIRLFRVDNNLSNEWEGTNVIGKFEYEGRYFWFSNRIVDKGIEVVPVIEISKSNIKD